MRVPPLDVVAAASAARVIYGVPASVQIAQWADESAWGAKCTGRFNFFGVKALPGQPGTLCWTHEQVNGHLVPAQLLFRDYAGVYNAFTEHARLLAGPRYPHFAGDLTAYVHAIAPIYATASGYAAALLSIITGDQLVRFDVP